MTGSKVEYCLENYDFPVENGMQICSLFIVIIQTESGSGKFIVVSSCACIKELKLEYHQGSLFILS